MSHTEDFRKAVSSACFISKSSCEPKPRISKVLSAISHLRCKKRRSGDPGWYFIRAHSHRRSHQHHWQTGTFVVTQHALELVASPRNIAASPRLLLLLCSFFFFFFFRENLWNLRRKLNNSPSILSSRMFLCSGAAESAARSTLSASRDDLTQAESKHAHYHCVVTVLCLSHPHPAELIFCCACFIFCVGVCVSVCVLIPSKERLGF